MLVPGVTAQNFRGLNPVGTHEEHLCVILLYVSHLLPLRVSLASLEIHLGGIRDSDLKTFSGLREFHTLVLSRICS